MILTVDIGNTTVHMCGVEKKQDKEYCVVFSEKTDTVKEKDSEFYYNEMKQKLAKTGMLPENFEGAVLVSVVPDLIEPICAGIEKMIKKKPLLITADSNLGFTSDVRDIHKVGLDRLVDAAWAAENYPLPIVTVDMGTATTFNVIDEGKVFRGGVIAAGLETSLNALSAKASQLPDINLCIPDKIIGKDTVECMLSGAVMGAAAMIDGIVSGIEKELGKNVTLLLTGGLSAFVTLLCSHEHTYDSELLPKGLALLYEWNR